MISSNITLVPSNFFRDRIIFYSILTSLIMLLASFVLTLINFPNLPAEIPIFYSAKINILANKHFIFLMPAVIMLVFIINLLAGGFFFSKSKFLAQVLTIATVTFGFLALWAQIKIILLF